MRQLYKLVDLRGYMLQASDGEIGKINELYFDVEHWVVRYFIVHMGGWVLGREVLIAPYLITELDVQNRLIETRLTCEQVKRSPLFDIDKPVSRQYEIEYCRYYGTKPYWEMENLSRDPVSPYILPHQGSAKVPELPHIRTSKEVRGNRIHASDGELGKVDDFIFDDRDWKIHYLVVNTSKWPLGKKVLIAIAWVNSFDWAASEITVDLDGDIIQSAPPYDASQLIDHDYEISLFKHYGRVMLKRRDSSDG